MKARVFLLLLMLVATAMPAGCWNSRELTDMLIVVGMGIDAVPDSDEFRVSFQAANSGAFTPVGGSTGALPVNMFAEQDSSIFGALRKASRRVPRRLFFGHIQLVVIGEQAARKGVNDVVDFFERSHEVRLNSTVLVSRGTTAEKIVSILTPLEKISSIGIAKRTRITSNIWGENADAKLTDLVNGLVGPGEPMISGIEIEGDPKLTGSRKNMNRTLPHAFVKVKGIALFRAGKLIGWLDGPLARGAALASGQLKSAVIDLPCEDPKGRSAIVVVRTQTAVKPKAERGKVAFTVKVKEEGVLGETHCPLNLETRKTIVALQNQWAEATRKELEAAIRYAQSKKSDVLDFGSAVQRSDPKAWKALEKDWPRIFAGSEVSVRVEAYIRRTGMRSNSFEAEQDKMEHKAEDQSLD